MARKGDKRTEKDLRDEFFDGPASDTMSFPEFLIKSGRGDLLTKKMKDGGEVFAPNSEYYKEFL
tara:strand:+ start:629 stop:820 length:192 start_codon:yes stop_codon:yes gene_type:complete